MHHFFVEMTCVVNAQTKSEEISNLHRGERRQTSEHHEQCCVEKKESKNRGQLREWPKFIALLGNREVTLKNDTELAIIAFRNRVVEVCMAEVAAEDAVKGYKE